MAGSRVLLWSVIVLVAVGFLYLVRSIIFPFAFGFFVSALVEPAIRKLRLRGFSRSAAVWLVFVGFFATISLIVAVAAPTIGTQVGVIQETGTKYINTYLFPPTKLDEFVADSGVARKLTTMQIPAKSEAVLNFVNSESSSSVLTNFFITFGPELRDHDLPANKDAFIEAYNQPGEKGPVDKFIEKNEEWLKRFGLPTKRKELEKKLQIEKRVKEYADSALGGASAIVQYLMSSIVLLILTPLVTLLILFDYDNYRRRFVTWIPPAIRPAATDLLGDVGEVLAKYLRGLTLSVSIYIGIMAIVLLILGVPYALFLSVLLGVFYLIPFVGPVFSAAAIALAIVTKGQMATLLFTMPSLSSYVILAVGVFFVANVLHDQLIHPNIIGKSIGLNPVVSLFVVFAGGALFGLTGMVLAFPMAGTVKVILDRLIRYTTTSTEATLRLPRVPKRHQG